MKKNLFLAIRLVIIYFVTSYSPTLLAGILPNGFAELRIAEGLDGTTVNYAPDGRIFVTQKKGVISIIKNGALISTPFLDIQTLVDNQNERGLQNLVFDPDFTTNGYIYIYYCAEGLNRNRIVRVTANGDVALEGSEIVILTLDVLPGDIHNGGALFFKDGKLFVTTGEGSNGNLAQSFSSLLGKVLRMNPDGSIPNDNPYYNTLSGNYRMIYALGFRNPYRAAVQPGTGKIFINDVGGSQFEEINELVSGKNYGWPIVEGTKTTQTAPANYQDPFYAYSHSEGCSIGGGAFYNPSVATFPSKYIGKYFFGDYCGNYIKVIDPTTGVILETFATGLNRPISFSVSPAGDFYFLARGGLGGGSKEANSQSCCSEVWRIQFTGSGVPTISAQPSNVVVPIGGKAQFVVGASGNAPLSYQWQRNGVNIPGANAFIYELASATLADNSTNFRAVITNSLGTATSNNALLTVTNNLPPQPTITLPTEGTKYINGTLLTFAGTATDPEDGALPASAFTWEINFHHNVHTHPAMAPISGITGGTYSIDIGEPSANVWYRIYLTVTDSQGETTTVSRDVYPITSHVTLAANQPELKLVLDGADVVSPYTFIGAAGINRFIEAPLSQLLNGTTYEFVGWSDGGTGAHGIQTPSIDKTYSAYYLPMTLEAEDATLSNAAKRFGYAGFTGQGYADYNANSGAYVEWNVNLPMGNYKLDFRYGNGSSIDRPLEIMVNGVVVDAKKSFPPTGLWTTWSMVTSDVNFIAGNNVIRVSTTGANGGNIDNMLIRKAILSIPKVETPVFNPISGTYTSAQQVTISTTTPGAIIYYTLDGSIPNTSSLVYSSPIEVASSKTIKAFAVKGGMDDSFVETASYSIDVNSPPFSVLLEAEDATRSGVPVKFSYAGFTGTGYGDYGITGTYIEWTVNTPASGTYILDFRYANGSSKNRPLQISINNVVVESGKAFPSTTSWTNWSLVSSSVVLNAGTNTIRATVSGTDGGNMDHLVVRQAGVSTPVFTPAPGTYSSSQSVTITSATTGATIYYTTNGSTPTVSSFVYSSPIVVSSNTTLKAYAVKSGINDSPVATAAYIISSVLPPFSTIFETENAVRLGVPIKFSYAGYTGTGYGDFTNASGDYIEWTVNVPATGNYNLDFRYGLATGNRPLELKVNGSTVIASKSFPATGSWTTWGIVSEAVALNAGNNLIRLTSIGSNGANLDHLKVSSISSIAKLEQLNEETLVEADEINIYPIPAQDILTLKSNRVIAFKSLTNMGGAMIHSQYKQINDNEVEVYLSNMDAGAYIMTIQSDKVLVRKKVIIVK